MFNIFELLISPMVYYACEVWYPLQRKVIKKLNKFTITYLRVALGLGKRGGCPLVSLFWHTGTYLPINKILFYKAMFVHHIANLEDSSLAKEFYVAQKNNSPNFPSVVNEVEEFLNDWNVRDYANMSKNQFRQTVKDILYIKNRNDLLDWTKKYRKVNYEKCEKEKFETKSYFKTMNITQSRLYFKVLDFITPTIRANFKSDKKFCAQKIHLLRLQRRRRGAKRRS